jgi:hypothetical protein
MRTIRRAAVTGLMAVWLAPLSAFADGASSNCADSAATQLEVLVVLEDSIQTELTGDETLRRDDLRAARRRLLRREG